MYDLATIQQMNEEAAAQAREERVEPLALEPGFSWPPPTPIPHIGTMEDAVDECCERVDTLFVDATGWGDDNEPALTQDQFRDKLREMVSEHGTLHVAIISAGQFQVHVGVWKP